MLHSCDNVEIGTRDILLSFQGVFFHKITCIDYIGNINSDNGDLIILVT